VTANVSPPVTITVSNFMTDVVEASAHTPTLVDFWAPWCGPCKQLMPVLDRIAAEYGGSFKLAKVNTDEQQELAQKVGVRSLPTVVLFKDRTAVDHFVGIVPEAQIRQLLDKHLPKKSDGPAARIAALKAAGDYTEARATAATSRCRLISPNCAHSKAISTVHSVCSNTCARRSRITLR
jgi:putative thioredoxin